MNRSPHSCARGCIGSSSGQDEASKRNLRINHSKDRFLAVLAGACVLIAVGGWIRDTSTESCVEYVGTLVATFAGVVIVTYFSVWQFYSQARANDEERSEQLAQSLAGELFTVLDTFGGIPTHYLPNPAGGPTPIPVILAQLEPIATQEAIRVGLLGAQSSANLSQLSNMMRDYSQVSDSLYPLLCGPMWDPRFLQHAIKLATELARVRTTLII